ncbi:MAE_28990/MAE_18760 family HEPN-like nuclease [Schleiferilactobacillus harbinensis]|uniref:MAE_28990/MAE_18760 family HEPN-like nuclease n=1 Tax=Schleiferilactobacillus harbinensis TaxID=304207 RepID=UPI0021BFCC91|nr:MAE_28990/MAE_18760 family HEPN-like nuclease [Schleiferilactobacillus harbinensis]
MRSAANLYVIFVFGRNVAVSKLVEGLQAVYFQQQFSAAQNSKTMVSLKDFFYEVRRQEILTPHRKYVDKREKRFINTASNLNSKRLNDILQLLELPTERFLLKENWVDTNLLRIRNEIAHGERISVSQVEFENTAVRVTKMMDDFSNVVLSAAESREFLKSTRLNRRAV